MTSRLRTVARDDDGFSLIELMMSMVIGGVVLTALMTVFIGSVKGTTQIENRVDNQARARVAMDRIVRLLDSQVCGIMDPLSDVATPPVLSGSDSNSVSFIGDLTGASGSPLKYTITYQPKTASNPGTLTMSKYSYNSATKAWGAQVGKTETLGTDILPAKDDGGVVQPIFSYYPYLTATTAIAPATPGDIADTPAGVPLSVAVAPTVVKVGVKFAAISSTSHTDDTSRAWVMGSGTLATFNADPDSPSACP
jgi:prepilin-type N-terminal cleavage/methylation domain-containing protein